MHGIQELKEGAVVQLGRITMSAEAIEQFAAAYDPQLQHLDGDAGMQTLLAGQAASGWHTCALLMQQMTRCLERFSLHVEVPAIEEIRWLRPVRPNDILEATIRLKSTCSMPGCRISGGWMVTIEALNQAHEPVVRMNGNALLAAPHSSPDVVSMQAQSCARRMKRQARAVRRPGGHLVRYFEEVELGDEIALGTYDLTASAVRHYQSIIDESSVSDVLQPHAMNDLRPRCLNGWLLVSAWMRRIVDYYHAECDWLVKNRQPVPILGPAAGVRSLAWSGPAQDGDQISFTSWAEHKVHFGTSSEWGLLVAGAEGINQRGEIVVSFYPQFLLQKRPN